MKPQIKSNIQQGLGGQLSRKVASGAITRQQAQKTSRQRKLLANAFGSDWRTQVYGKGGAKGISGPFAQRQVATLRRQAIERAKRKVGAPGNGGTTAREPREYPLNG